MNVVIDSSIIIDFTRAGLGPLVRLIDFKKKEKLELLIPTIVVAELWAGEEMGTKEGRAKLEKLLARFKQIELTTEIAKKTGNLLRSKSAAGFDAIVAATALCLDAQLATQNKKHFQSVPGLKLFKTQKG